MPVKPRDPISEDSTSRPRRRLGRIMAAYHLKQAGVTNFRNIDHAGDFGGVWYWNRYPGIQCDNDAYCYLPLLEETGFMPSKKFADGCGDLRVLQAIAKKFGFSDKALFHTLINRCAGTRRSSAGGSPPIAATTSARASSSWPAASSTCRSCPAFPASTTSRARCSTPRAGTTTTPAAATSNPVLDKLADKRVAIVGTGATAIQAVPYLGKYAKQLYVIQRTPSSVDERPNPPTDPEWVKIAAARLAEGAAGQFPPRRDGILPPGEPDLICDIWTEISRNLAAELAAEGWPAADVRAVHGAARSGGLPGDGAPAPPRRRHRQGQATAEALKPWYRFLCKRPLSNDDYYPTFNRPNVKLIDVSATKGVERMTEKGFVANGNEYEIDCMIFASGFEVTSDLESPLGHRRGRRPRRRVDLRSLGRRAQDAPRHDDARFPEPVLHRLHPGRPQRDRDRAVRQAGLSHRLHHQRGAEARRRSRRAEPGSAGRLRAGTSRKWRSTSRSSSANARRAISTTRAR